jgi:TfoX/Sxy family transcriptional regulator of competence genes
MASELSFVQYICEQLDRLPGIAYRKMFGEYAFYHDQKVVALICDNQFFLKPTDAGKSLLGTPEMGVPYPGAKPYFVVTDIIEDTGLFVSLIVATSEALPMPKPKSKKKTP